MLKNIDSLDGGGDEGEHYTALTLACINGNEECAELLIAKGAQVDHKDGNGFTPLIWVSSGARWFHQAPYPDERHRSRRSRLASMERSSR